MKKPAAAYAAGSFPKVTAVTEPVDPARHLRQVRTYYDRNTRRFLRWGTDDGTLHLHAALWPPGVTSLREAMHHSSERVAREIERSPIPVERVVDLGCGVGGSLFYLGRRLPRLRTLTGISLSPVQIAHAKRLVPGAEKDRFHFEAGTFLNLSGDRFAADLAFAIEAFAHGPDPGRFFALQAALLPPGGRLVIIDDCFTNAVEAGGISGRQRRLLETYRRNWLLPGLRSASTLKSLAAEKRLTLLRDEDLTPYLRLGRPRDRVISLFVRWAGPLMERNTYFKSLVGGDAKQKCYAEGVIRYRLLVFENRTLRAAA